MFYFYLHVTTDYSINSGKLEHQEVNVLSSVSIKCNESIFFVVITSREYIAS